jgi:hypothetical protein
MTPEARDRQIERQQRQKWVTEIETEYASMKAQEVETGQHNRYLHKAILKSWKTDSPDMWANLRKDGHTSRTSWPTSCKRGCGTGTTAW